MGTSELDRRLHASVLKREAIKEKEYREKRAKEEEEFMLGIGGTEMSKAELRKIVDSDRRMYYRTEELNDKLYIHYKGWKQLQNLEGWTGLKALYAECNAFDRIGGLQCCTKLRSLFLQENCIKRIDGLENCHELWNLNLSSNFIERIEGLSHLKNLNTLIIAKNKIGFGGMDDVIELANTTISCLDIQDNKIWDPDILPEVLMQMPQLRVLYLKGNACSKRIPNYRKSVTVYCKGLTYLDDRPVFEEDRRAAEAFNRGGLEEERAERRRIRQENDARHERNMRAFSEMVERAKSEKRERTAMRAEDKYTDETDPVDSEERKLKRHMDQWNEEHKEELKDDALERAERMLASEKNEREGSIVKPTGPEGSVADAGLPATQDANKCSCETSEAEIQNTVSNNDCENAPGAHDNGSTGDESKEDKPKEDTRQLIYEDIWDDVVSSDKARNHEGDAVHNECPAPPSENLGQPNHISTQPTWYSKYEQKLEDKGNPDVERKPQVKMTFRPPSRRPQAEDSRSGASHVQQQASELDEMD